MFKVIVTHTDDIDQQDALNDLFEQAETKLNGRKTSCRILWASLHYDHVCIVNAIMDQYLI